MGHRDGVVPATLMVASPEPVAPGMMDGCQFESAYSIWLEEPGPVRLLHVAAAGLGDITPVYGRDEPTPMDDASARAALAAEGLVFDTIASAHPARAPPSRRHGHGGPQR